MTTKNRLQGEAYEKEAAFKTGLDITPGSGCGQLFKGDLNNEEWLIEVKSTRQKRYIFDYHWWVKAKQQATDKLKEKIAVLSGFSVRPVDYKGVLDFAITEFRDDVPVLATIKVAARTKTIPLETLSGLVDSQIILECKNDKLTFITRRKFLQLNEDLRN